MAIPFHIPTPEETEDSYRLIYQLLNDLCDLLRQIVIGQRQIPIAVPPQPAPRNRTNGTRRAEAAEQRVGQPDAHANLEGEIPALPVLPLPDIVLSTLSSAITTTSPCTAHSCSNNSNSAITTATTTTTSATTTTTSSIINGHTTADNDTRSSTSSSEQLQSSQPPQRPPRRRRRTSRVPTKDTNEELTTRLSQTVREDWVKVGEDLRRIADEFRTSLQDSNRKQPIAEHKCKAQKSILSLLIPAPLRGSLWTAVILLLGWRLFQAAL